jgi:predicted permease
VRRDVDEELRYHVERLVEKLIAEGVDPAEARRRARARFGDVEAYRRALERIDHGAVRETRRGAMMDGVWKSVTLAVRGVRRAPGFAFAVITILALGLGANAVMFEVVDRLLLSPPTHVVDPEDVRLLYLQRTDRGSGQVTTGRTLTYPDFQDFRRVAGFVEVAAYTRDRMTFGRGQGAREVEGEAASASLFPLLGVRPALGRFFTPEEDAPGVDGVAVLSWAFWETQYGKDPAVLGRTVDVGDGRYTVVGVAPEGFTGAALSHVDLWLPLERAQEIATGGTQWRDNRNWWWVHTVARIAPGASAESAQAEATAAHRAGRQDLVAEGRYSKDATILAAPILAARGPDPSAESRVARWLAAVSAIVLLIACFNVANLLLARAARARREVAVRVALGVSRTRLLAELLTESLVLALLGGGAALLVARVGGRALNRVLLPDVAFTGTGPGIRLIAFLGIATLLTGVLAGVVPALHAGRADVASVLKSGAPGSARGRSRTRVFLLVAQAALSVVLLVGAGLFVRSLDRARGLDLGWDPSRVAVVELEWNEALPATDRTALYEEALERVRRLPGVRAAGFTYTVFFQSSVGIGSPRVPGIDSIPRPSSGGPYANKVSAGYFEALGLEIVEGRTLEPPDDAATAPPVAVVSRSMARGIWPGGDAVGSCMYLDEDVEQAPCTMVVGVVEDHRRQELVEAEPHWLYYLNQSQPAFQGPPQGIMAGTADDARRVVRSIRAELGGLATSRVRFVSVRSLQDHVDPQLRSWRLGASMFSVFGVLALVVAAWGLYSVLAFEVALLRRDLGIRAALGAGRARLVGSVLRRALALVGLGTLLGLAAAAAGAGFVEPLLFQEPARDPAVYLSVAAVLLVTAALAGSLPAWRATRVDPREALQAE